MKVRIGLVRKVDAIPLNGGIVLPRKRPARVRGYRQYGFVGAFPYYVPEG